MTMPNLRALLTLVALALAIPAPVAAQDCLPGQSSGPVVLWDTWAGPFYLWGTTPAVTTVEVEIWTTPPGGGAPGLVSTVGPFVLPAGPVGTWGPVFVAALGADPNVAFGPLTTVAASLRSFTVAPAGPSAGDRLAFRVHSTTSPPLAPWLPLGALSTPFPAAPAQIMGMTCNYADAAATGAAAREILGNHWFALPPDRGGIEGLSAGVGTRPPPGLIHAPVPAVSFWGLLVMSIGVVGFGITVLLTRRIGGASL